MLAKFKMWVEAFYLCYNTNHMSKYGAWQTRRGISNSKSIEPALLAYRGKALKCIPKKHMYVDGGSSLFNEVMQNVPLLAPQHQAFVHRDVRATSLLSMLGVPHDEDKGEQQKLKLLPAEDDDCDGAESARSSRSRGHITRGHQHREANTL